MLHAMGHAMVLQLHLLEEEANPIPIYGQMDKLHPQLRDCVLEPIMPL